MLAVGALFRRSGCQSSRVFLRIGGGALEQAAGSGTDGSPWRCWRVGKITEIGDAVSTDLPLEEPPGQYEPGIADQTCIPPHPPPLDLFRGDLVFAATFYSCPGGSDTGRSAAL